jgi:hypothetical protein
VVEEKTNIINTIKQVRLSKYTLHIKILLTNKSMGIISDTPSVSTATKWLGFVAAIWIQSISGNNYTFSNYSDALKSLMHLTQLQLNNLSVAKDVGKAFGLLAGLASDRLPTWAILLIGSFEGLIGYGVQWLVVGQIIQPLPYWQVLYQHCSSSSLLNYILRSLL